MSEQEQHFDTSGADVSRETLGSTEPENEATEEITREQQMLYDIMDRSMTKNQERPDGESPEEDPAPPQEEPEAEQQDSPPPPQKNKPSSFYVYLAVLFGAAFLMLLLAYFVQQRNNATAMDDLRMTSTASRQELLEQIQELEEKRDWLQNAYDLQRERNDRVDEQNKSLQERSDQYWEALTKMTTRYENAYTLDCLERFVRSRDYLMASTIVAWRNWAFDQNDPNYSETREAKQYTTPAQREKYLDLRTELFRSSDLLTLVQEGDERGHYAGTFLINTDAIGREEMDTAQYLWFIVLYYATDPDWSAYLLTIHYDSLTQNSGLFKPSTMELLEEIKEDLIAQDLVTEENGVLTANVSLDESEDGIWESLHSDPTKVILE